MNLHVPFAFLKAFDLIRRQIEGTGESAAHTFGHCQVQKLGAADSGGRALVDVRHGGVALHVFKSAVDGELRSR